MDSDNLGLALPDLRLVKNILLYASTILYKYFFVLIFWIFYFYPSIIRFHYIYSNFITFVTIAFKNL